MAKAGRPKIQIPLAKFKALMRFKPTLKDTAAFFECSEDTVINQLEELTGSRDFTAFREENMVHTRLALIRKAISMAEAGNVPMLIFALKNMCGWKDKHEEIKTDIDKKEFKLNYDLEKSKKK